jgi:hypothetical protein
MVKCGVLFEVRTDFLNNTDKLRLLGFKGVCIRKVLRPAISTQVFLVFLCLQSNAEMLPKFQVATACFSCSPPNFKFIKITPVADAADLIVFFK